MGYRKRIRFCLIYKNNPRYKLLSGIVYFCIKHIQMKRSLIILIWLFTIPSFGQSFESLKSNCKKLYDASYLMDFDAILDLTYPKLFDIIDRDSMYLVLEETFQNDTFRIRFVHPNPAFTYSEIKEIGGKKFCLIEYNNAMRMILENELSVDDIQEMEKSLKANMNHKKITHEKKRNAFYIEGKEIMIAVSDELTQNQWRFINHDPQQLDLLYQLLDKKIVNQLGLK